MQNALHGSVLVVCVSLALTGQWCFAQADTSGGASTPRNYSLPSSISPNTQASLKIKLPFEPGSSYEVYQGNGGSFSHAGLNRYAWDFGLPEGTPICAAAEGRVVRVKQDSNIGGPDSSLFSQANTVILDHGNGYFTQYLHLQKSSVLVSEGDLVPAGQVIAYSGNTGFSSVPHLHFQVQDATGQSLPATFLDMPGGIPRQGQKVTSGNDGLGVSRYAGESQFPLNAFAYNHVELRDCTLPAHRLLVDRKYTLEGQVQSKVKRVALFLMKPEGGNPLYSCFAEVKSDGTFQLDFSLDSLKGATKWSDSGKNSNMFALAIAPVEEDGSYWSSFSVPITVK